MCNLYNTVAQPYHTCTVPLQGLPTTSRCFSLYKHFVTPNSSESAQPPLREVVTSLRKNSLLLLKSLPSRHHVRFALPQIELFSLAEESGQPPLGEVDSHPQGELSSLAGVFVTTTKRGFLSTSLRLTTKIAAASPASHNPLTCSKLSTMTTKTTIHHN